MNTIEVVEESTLEEKPKKSNGQIFKELKGYSKTIKRLMQKHNCSSVEEYRTLRKKNKVINAAKAKANTKKVG